MHIDSIRHKDLLYIDILEKNTGNKSKALMSVLLFKISAKAKSYFKKTWFLFEMHIYVTLELAIASAGFFFI
jgi:hypothetical protein